LVLGTYWKLLALFRVMSVAVFIQGFLVVDPVWSPSSIWIVPHV
jgi:hypothetical protein